jgi:hypothetical protein
MKIAVFAVLVCIILSSCSDSGESTSPAAPSEPMELTGTWRLVSQTLQVYETTADSVLDSSTTVMSFVDDTVEVLTYDDTVLSRFYLDTTGGLPGCVDTVREHRTVDELLGTHVLWLGSGAGYAIGRWRDISFVGSYLQVVITVSGTSGGVTGEHITTRLYERSDLDPFQWADSVGYCVTTP